MPLVAYYLHYVTSAKSPRYTRRNMSRPISLSTNDCRLVATPSIDRRRSRDLDRINEISRPAFRHFILSELRVIDTSIYNFHLGAYLENIERYKLRKRCHSRELVSF